MRSTLYKLLDNPVIYKVAQKILGSVEKVFYNPHLAAILKEAQGSLLDVGCGPVCTPLAPDGITFGVDPNLHYIKEYSKYPNQKGVVGLGDVLPLQSEAFGETRCVGLLHHQADGRAVGTIREMNRCTRPQGRVIIIDSVWPKIAWQRPIAWLIRRFDRGEWVRSEEQLKELVSEACPGDWQTHRYTYSPVGHEVLVLILKK